MDRSKQLSEVTRKSLELISNRARTNMRELNDHLMKTVNLLYTHQDYTDHLELLLADDLAWLPKEVIDGVLESEVCGEAFYEDFANLALLNGSWAEFGREFATADRRLRSSDVQNDADYNFAHNGTYKRAEFCDLSIDRSQQLSKVVGKCLKLQETLKNPDTERITYNDFTHLLMQSVQFMCANQDYIDHLELNLANDFANLPNTIIADIVNTAGCVHMTISLALIQGPWAESAGGYCLFGSTTVKDTTELSTLKTNAPQLYNSIAFNCVPDQFSAILELLDTRFAEVYWYGRCDYSRSESTLIQLTKFLKRQLKSKYLRIMAISGKTRTEGLNELLVDFVKRPQFEYLLNETVDPLPFEVIEEAHKAWESAKRFAVNRKWINGTTSAETLKKIDEKFKLISSTSTTIDDPDILEWRSKHPRHSAAEMSMIVFKNRRDQLEINLQFRKLNDERVLS